MNTIIDWLRRLLFKEKLYEVTLGMSVYGHDVGYSATFTVPLNQKIYNRLISIKGEYIENSVKMPRLRSILVGLVSPKNTSLANYETSQELYTIRKFIRLMDQNEHDMRRVYVEEIRCLCKSL